MNTWCPQCGPHAAVDEDGCCLVCGCDAVGDGVDEMAAALESALAGESAALEELALTHMELDSDYEAGKARGREEERERWLALVERVRTVRHLALTSGGNVYGYDDALAILSADLVPREP